MNIHKLQTIIFNIVIYTTYILYLLITLGLSENAPEYLDNIQYYTKLYISLFLIYRFNPFRQVKFTSLDAKITFSAGLFLLSTTFVNSIIKSYLSDIKIFLHKII